MRATINDWRNVINPAEILSLATARCKPFERLPSGIPVISVEDVLHGLGRIPHKGATLLIRVKWLDQTQFVMDLDRLFWLRICQEWAYKKWPQPLKSPGHEFRRNMGRMALAENIDPQICLDCGGVAQQVMTTGKINNCGPCRGLGRVKPTDSARARFMDMPRDTFRSPWGDIYRDVQSVADQWERIALGTFNKQLTQTSWCA